MQQAPEANPCQLVHLASCVALHHVSSDAPERNDLSARQDNCILCKQSSKLSKESLSGIGQSFSGGLEVRER